jgi:hypothetical protein
MNGTHPRSTPVAPTTGPAAVIFLALSALALAAVLWLLVASGQRLVGGTPVLADVTATTGDYVVATVDGGTDDVLVVLDHRTETLLVYRLTNQTTFDLRSRQSVREMFINARSGTPGPAPVPGRSGAAGGERGDVGVEVVAGEQAIGQAGRTADPADVGQQRLGGECRDEGVEVVAGEQAVGRG